MNKDKLLDILKTREYIDHKTINKTAVECYKNNDIDKGLILWQIIMIQESYSTKFNYYTLLLSLFIIDPRLNLDSFDKIMNPKTEQIYSLFIRGYIKQNRLDKALNLFYEMKKKRIYPHRRTYIAILKYLSESNHTLTNSIFEELIGEFELNNEICEIMLKYKDVPYPLLFNKMSKDRIILNDNKLINNLGVETKIINDKCKICNCKFQYLFDNHVILKYLEKKIKKLTQFKKFLDSFHYDTLIDAGNVSFYASLGHHFNYDHLKQVENKVKNPLIIIHTVRVNKNKSIPKNWYVVPKGMNDDIYWLYALFYKRGVKVVTNDEITDHFNDINVSKSHIKSDYWIRYKIENNVVKLNKTVNYTKAIQTNNNGYHIPIHNNEWWCVKLETI